MTEEDTFKALKRRPLREVCNEFKSISTQGLENLIIHMEKNNWTVRDYLDDYYSTATIMNSRISKEEWVETYIYRYKKEAELDGIKFND